MRLECRWCSKLLDETNLYPNKRGAHEERCLSESKGRNHFYLTVAVREYARHQLQWSINQAKRWRSLPGKGWGALNQFPMVEFLGKVDKS